MVPRTKSKAVIWDMDGVIVDTAPYHFKAWQHVFQKRGVNFNTEKFRSNFGQRNDAIIRNTLGEDISLSEIEIIAGDKEESFRKKVKDNIKELPGVIKLMTSLKVQGFKMALASSAPIENIWLLTRSLGINSYFQVIISGQDVLEGKPSPQGFLLAAEKMDVAPRNGIVIEDAVAGVIAAKRAGMHCLAVTNTHPRRSLNEADLVVSTLEAVAVKDLERLLDSSSAV
ncbi:HAD family hydrolase [Chloroflexota bacterium]